MRLRFAGGLDLATGALILGGAVLLAASFIVAVSVLSPPPAPAPVAEVAPVSPVGRAAQTLPADRVAAVLSVDAGAGAGAATRAGDRVDVLGYFSRQVKSDPNLTRLLLQDVPVLSADRSGSSVALTLAVPQDQALLLREAQAPRAHPFVLLRAAGAASPISNSATTFSDVELVARLAGEH